MMRPDKRQPTQLRPIGCKFSQLINCSGSARFNFGESEVLCSVYGPLESKLKEEKIDRATIEVIFKTPQGYTTTKERLYEKTLKDILSNAVITTLLPRTNIKVIVQILNDAGGILSVAANASIMALVDAEIPLKYLTASVTCMIDNNGCPILDPVEEELKNAHSVSTFVFESAEKNIISIMFTGDFTSAELSSCQGICKSACLSLFVLYRQSIVKKIEWDLQ